MQLLRIYAQMDIHVDDSEVLSYLSWSLLLAEFNREPPFRDKLFGQLCTSYISVINRQSVLVYFSWADIICLYLFSLLFENCKSVLNAGSRAPKPTLRWRPYNLPLILSPLTKLRKGGQSFTVSKTKDERWSKRSVRYGEMLGPVWRSFLADLMKLCLDFRSIHPFQLNTRSMQGNDLRLSLSSGPPPSELQFHSGPMHF